MNQSNNYQYFYMRYFPSLGDRVLGEEREHIWIN